MTTTTRRKVLAGAAALPLLPAAALAAPVTLPLLPVSAFAQPAEDGPDLLAMLDDLAALPPEPRELSIRIIRMLAEKQRERRGLPS